MSRRQVASRLVAAALGLVLLVPSSSLANGDPASDVLLADDVFVPYPAPSRPATSALRQSVVKAYDHGYRLKVAVIASQADLGAIPSLFGKPTEYAKFLGLELSAFYIGPLLIVMPAGYGIYDGGRSVSAVQRVLAGISLDGSSTDALTGSATRAVRALVAAKALRSKDIKAPYLYVTPMTARVGRPMTLTYRVIDDSHHSAETIRISSKQGRQLKVVRTGFHSALWNQTHVVTWSLPSSEVRAGLRFCIGSVDRAGNKSLRDCQTIAIKR